jgi:LmbE family N-acetylglucosaminyl deacetylase
MEAGGRVAVVVAHPDDETLWAGGLLLLHPEWEVTVAALCRGSDPDRAPRFHRVAQRLGAVGRMADLEDGPEQRPLPEGEVEETVMGLVGNTAYDLLLTHGPRGEYTRHLRHEEASRAVTSLWRQGKLRAARLWQFAYEDGGGAYLPRAAEEAPIRVALPPEVWEEKYRIIREEYGVAKESKEARTTPRVEAFWEG